MNLRLRWIILLLGVFFYSQAQDSITTLKISSSDTLCGCSDKMNDSLAFSKIKIKVMDQKTKAPIKFFTVKVTNGNNDIVACVISREGSILVGGLPGHDTYNVKVCLLGYENSEIKGVVLGEGKTSALSFSLIEDKAWIKAEKKKQRKKKSG